MKNPKYWRGKITTESTSQCPRCSKVNNHKTGDVCHHCYKVTSKGVVFYYWGCRKLGWLSGLE